MEASTTPLCGALSHYHLALLPTNYHGLRFGVHSQPNRWDDMAMIQ